MTGFLPARGAQGQGRDVRGSARTAFAPHWRCECGRSDSVPTSLDEVLDEVWSTRQGRRNHIDQNVTDDLAVFLPAVSRPDGGKSCEIPDNQNLSKIYLHLQETLSVDRRWHRTLSKDDQQPPKAPPHETRQFSSPSPQPCCSGSVPGCRRPGKGMRPRVGTA